MMNIFLLVYGTEKIEFGSEATKEKIEENYNNRITQDINKITGDSDQLPKYKVTVSISDVTKMVYKVVCSVKN